MLDSAEKIMAQLACFIFILYYFVGFLISMRIDSLTKKFNKQLAKSYIETWEEEGDQKAKVLI